MLGTIKKLFKYFKNARALSLGIGAGNEEVDLIKNGWDISAIDAHHRAQEIINERIKGLVGKFEFQLGEFKQIKMSGKYNLTLALFALPFREKHE